MDANGMQADVVVVGAGPVGLLLAAELRRHGAAVLIVDKTSGTKSISKALIQHVRTQEVMDAVGVAAAVQRQSVPLRRVEVHAYGRHAGQWRLDEVDSPHPGPVILGQDRTERILEQRLQQLGGQVAWHTEAGAWSRTQTASTCGCTGRTMSDPCGPAMRWAARGRTASYAERRD